LCAAMNDCLGRTAVSGQDAYERWEADQPRPMPSALRRLVPASQLARSRT